MSAVKSEPHVCMGCGRRDTLDASQLCAVCRRGTPWRNVEAQDEEWHPCDGRSEVVEARENAVRFLEECE